MRTATLKRINGDGEGVTRPIFIIDDKEDLAQLFAAVEEGGTADVIASEYAAAAAGQAASPQPPSLNIVADVHMEVRQPLQIVSMSKSGLYVRFFDVDQPVDDLPAIIYDGKTWLPYTGTRLRNGSKPGYHVEYAEEGTMAVRAMGRMGKSNGVTLDLTEPPAKPEPRTSWVWSQISPEDRSKLPKLEADLLKAGWVKSPNNIHGLQGSTWYSSGPDKKCLPYPQEAQVLSDRIRVFTTKFFGTHYTKLSFTDTVTVAVFDSVEAFLAWVEVVGVPKPPPGPNVFD